MNWKNIGKIFGIGLAFSLLLLVGLTFWGLSKLPSAFELKQTLTPPVLQETAHGSAPHATGSESQTPPSLPEKESKETVVPPSHENELRTQTLRVLTEDFMDTRKPLVDACRIMNKAEHSGFLKDRRHASARYFFSHLTEDNRDPLSETAAPVFREVFRTPGMQQVLEMIVQAEENKDPGLLKKAEFYYQIYKAGTALKDNVEDINRILQQSYNLHTLMKAVAIKPELAHSPQIISFCEDLQKDLNTSTAINPDQAAQEMTAFLETQGIKPADIGYDPQYRSHVDLNISNTQIRLNDSWIAQIFAADIEKALKQKSQ